MNIALDDGFDAHWIYVDHFQKTTLNIVVKAHLDIMLDESIFCDALAALEKKHPYITHSVQTTDDEPSGFTLTPTPNKTLSYNIYDLGESNSHEIMEHLSTHLRKRLKLTEGELLNINLYHDKNSCVIEFVCAHLLGDMAAVCLLFQDFLSYIDLLIDGQIENISAAQRALFDEVRYGWAENKIEGAPFPLPEARSDNNDWPMPELDYQRFIIHLDRFKTIANILKEANIKGTVSDVFYYIAAKLFNSKLSNQPQFTTVQSFRSLLKTDIEQVNISTLAAFKPITVDDSLLDTPKSWIEDFSQQRQNGLNPDEILGLIQFLRSFNLSLNGVDEDIGKTALFQLIPISAFAFNNFGKLDNYFTGYQHFSVKDINCHDAVPGEFIRVYGFKDNIYVTPIFYKNSQLTVDAFWEFFIDELDNIVTTFDESPQLAAS